LCAGAGIPLLASAQVTAGAALALGLIAALGCGRLALLQALWRAARTPLGLGVVVLFIAWLPAVIGSLEPLRSFSIWARMIGLVLGATLYGQFLIGAPAMHRLALKALIIAALAVGLLGLIGTLGFSPPFALLHGKGWRAVDVVRDLKYYASALACLAPVVLWAGFTLSGRLWRLAALLHLPLALALIVSLHSGAALLGLGLGLGVGAALLFAFGRTLKGYAVSKLVLGLVFAIGAVILGLLFAYAPSPPPLEVLAQGDYDGPLETPLPLWMIDAHRQQIWGFSLHAMLQSPWIGYGMDLSNYVPGAAARIVRFNQAFIPAHPHDWIIEILIDTGFIGLGGLLVPLSLLLRRWLARGFEDRWSSAAGLALFVAFFASSLLNFSIWSAWWQTVFLILSALIFAAPRAVAATNR
jgi:O-antigen ligase